MKSLSRLELEAIVRGIPAAVIVIEKATGRIIYENDIANSLFGVGLKGLTITSDTERIVKVFSSTGGRYSFDKLPVRQALAKGIEVEDEFVIERPDGSRVVVRGLAKPVKDEHGSITAAVGIFEDITQRKTYEEGLRESQERFRLVAEAAKVLVYELNLEKGNIVILRGEDVIGYKTGEIPRDKQWWLNQIHPEDRVYTEENLRKAVDKGADYFLEYRIKCKSGNYIIAHDTGKAIANVEGKVTKFVSGMRDVTERKKAEQDLRTSEARFRALYENSYDAVLLTVPDGTILSANPAAQHMFGMTEEEIRKAGREGLVVNDQRLKFALKRRAETGSFHTELTYRRKDGSTFEGEVTSNIFRDADGSVKTSMIVRDITERKNAEEALRRSEERFSKAFNVNPAAISISRINDGLLVNVNETYLSLSGFSREEVIGRTSTKLGFFTDSSSRKQLLELLQARGTVRNYEMAFLTKNRKLINATVSLDKITIDNEDYMISTVTDITERKRMELSLQEYTKNLEALVEQRTKELKEKERLAAIGQTAGMVGHDIRNPLQAMLSDVYLLKCELESMNQCRTKESVTESLDSLESNIAYVNKIVSDLQDYTKALKPSIEEVNIKEIIWSTLSTNIQTNIETEVIVEDSLCVKADRTYLKRVMSNLVINAVQAMPNGGKLTVRSKRQQDELVISVEDTGVGIPDDIKPNLFTPLFTTKSKGQGLGLAVVRRLVVEGLGGKISFVTDIGKGTKFVVSLPTKQ